MLHINKIYTVKTQNNLLFPENTLFMDTARSENKFVYNDMRLPSVIKLNKILLNN